MGAVLPRDAEVRLRCDAWKQCTRNQAPPDLTSEPTRVKVLRHALGCQLYRLPTFCCRTMTSLCPPFFFFLLSARIHECQPYGLGGGFAGRGCSVAPLVHRSPVIKCNQGGAPIRKVGWFHQLPTPPHRPPWLTLTVTLGPFLRSSA